MYTYYGKAQINTPFVHSRTLICVMKGAPPGRILVYLSYRLGSISPHVDEKQQRAKQHWQLHQVHIYSKQYVSQLCVTQANVCMYVCGCKHGKVNQKRALVYQNHIYGGSKA